MAGGQRRRAERTRKESRQNYTFLYDGDEQIGEFDPSSNSFVHAYIWGANGLNTRISDPVGLSTTVLGYSFDPSGNVVGRHSFGDYQQPVQSAQLFDAFGERIYDEETTALSEPAGFKGHAVPPRWGYLAAGHASRALPFAMLYRPVGAIWRL